MAVQEEGKRGMAAEWGRMKGWRGGWFKVEGPWPTWKEWLPSLRSERARGLLQDSQSPSSEVPKRH